jgi:4-amino-4-deoxy-L-arabinose transferase-like glycosyltransferase
MSTVLVPGPGSPASEPGSPGSELLPGSLERPPQGGVPAGQSSADPDGHRPTWSIPARAVIFVLTGGLYTWDLARVGMGNTFYAAAVKSGTESWKAFFFGSLDPGSFITVDKPPAALWVMELSGRVFGFSYASMLVPEALAGVATVMVIYHVVRRWAGEPAAVLASLAMALTPVAVVLFRYNDPDAFLVLLLTLAGWALWSAIETSRTSRLVLSASLLGLAFLTKTLDAVIVVPAFAGVYLWCGPPRLRCRLGQLGWAALALVVSSGWWIAIVELWPAGSRPYIGGSTDNSEFNLIFGYNGFARIFGSSTGGTPGGGTSGTVSVFGGGEGVLRMFDSALGGQISWLLPLGVAGLVAGLWLTRRLPRTSLHRAGFLLFGGWLVLVMAVYDDAKGTFHPYYTAILAPAVAALAGAGAVSLWKLGRTHRWWSWALPVTIVGSAIWADVLLDRSPGYYPWLGTTVVVTASLAAVTLLLVSLDVVRLKLAGLVAGAVATASLLAGPTVYSLTTLNSATSGVATAGPATSGSGGLGGGAPAGGGAGRPPGRGATGAPPTGAPSGAGAPTGRAGAGGAAPTGAAGHAPGGGGGGGGQSVSAGLVTYLEAHQGSATYLVAVDGSQTAASYILDTGKAVIAMGGFTGTDPAPTLTQFESLVATGQLHYVYLGGSGGGAARGGGSSSTTSTIQQWLTEHGTVVKASAYGGSASGGTLYSVSPSSVTS